MYKTENRLNKILKFLSTNASNIKTIKHAIVSKSHLLLMCFIGVPTTRKATQGENICWFEFIPFNVGWPVKSKLYYIRSFSALDAINDIEKRNSAEIINYIILFIYPICTAELKLGKKKQFFFQQPISKCILPMQCLAMAHFTLYMILAS